ncbi:hypothetical protein [Pelagibius sp.]|uniref:hypothetical protein n=1 Tax=Pelagibius sp. TaxID=1931238 RepID=UPI0026347958|nr:hypothetical protein [Pelagibius sp.]
MADLQQIVGAILRDLAKARFSADLYSRSIARYYENDYLLRKFPVPRADFEEVEIDLKFSIAGVPDSEVNNESQEANAAVLFERSVERLVASFLDIARARNQDDQAFNESWWKYLSKGFNSTALRIEMRQKVLRYFIESYTHMIDDDGNFNAALVLGELERPFRWAMEAFAKEDFTRDEEAEQQMKRDLRELILPIIGEDAIKQAVAAMAGPIKTIWQGNSDTRLDIMIEGGQLSQLSDAALSSVKIKAVVRNMVWTEVKVGDRTTRHALTSE